MLTHRLSLGGRDGSRSPGAAGHQNLIDQPGLYRQFWQIQSGFVISHDGRRAEITAQRLQAIPLFADIETEMLGHLARSFQTEHYDADGANASSSSCAVACKCWPPAAIKTPPLHVAVLEDGDYFGEDAMMDGTTCTTGVQVEFPTLVLCLKRSDF